MIKKHKMLLIIFVIAVAAIIGIFIYKNMPKQINISKLDNEKRL